MELPLLAIKRACFIYHFQVFRSLPMQHTLKTLMKSRHRKPDTGFCRDIIQN